MLVWHRIWISVLGWEPPVEYLPAFVTAIVFYLSALTVGYSLYRLAILTIPHPLKDYVLDFIKTMTFCAYPFGHGIARASYGQLSYMILKVPVYTLTVLTMPQGIGNPLGALLSYVKVGKRLWESMLQCIVSMLGGLAAYRLGILIQATELHPLYVQKVQYYITGQCPSDLVVPVFVGFLIEFLGSLYETWLFMQVLSKNVYLDLVLKFGNAAILVGLGVNYTGMHLNPAMATGHTFGCGQIALTSNILVYWIGPMIAAYLAFLINKRFHLEILFRDSKTRRRRRL